MNITLIQTQLHWENRGKNISHFNTLIDSIKETTDLIVLPEMFTTGFTMNPEKNAEPANGETLQWLKQKAKEKNAVITGSVAVEENKKYYNRLFWVEPNGNVTTYNKRHLFRMAKEDQHYTPGTEKIIMPVKDWNVCPLVCYDLRFPVWSRNRFRQFSVGSSKSAIGNGQKAEGSDQQANRHSEAGPSPAEESQPLMQHTGHWDYDVLLYVANWPEVRSYPWKQLLIARAIENQCYVVGVNRIGKDGNDFAHSGDSVVINPRGEIISTIKPHEDRIETVTLDRNYLEEFRKVFPVGLDADDFEM